MAAAKLRRAVAMTAGWMSCTLLPGWLPAQMPSLERSPAPAAPRADAGAAPGGAAPAPLPTARPATASEVRPGDLVPVEQGPPRVGLRVSKGSGVLPNEHGQIWREYDISPYTLRAGGTARPEQAIIDWILRDTGTEVWFSEPLGILSASSTTLRVYHTPQMQARVRAIVERFVGHPTLQQTLSVRLMTVGNPNWRADAVALLRPVDVKSPGVEGWVLARDSAALLVSQLRRRADFREHTAPQIEVIHGQTHTLSRTQMRHYPRSVQLKAEFPFYDLVPGQIEEGYRLQISPLLSLDGQTLEAAIACQVDQVERMVPLVLDLPVGNPPPRVTLQVPQLVSWRLSERFRWPAQDVLLLSCGVVANPAPTANGMMALLTPLGITSTRADALLMVELRTPTVSGALPALATATPPIAAGAATAGAASPPLRPVDPVSRGRY